MPTSGQIITVFGNNFGTDKNFMRVTWGNIRLSIFSLTFLNNKYQLLCHIPPGVNHTVKSLTIFVNDQDSSLTPVNKNSKTFFFRYGPPSISRVDLGKNTRTAGGYLVWVYGQNFGNRLDVVDVYIGGILAEVVSVDHGSIGVLVAEGQGRGRHIYAQVLRESTLLAKETFDYSPPRVDYLTSTFDKIFPTSGIDPFTKKGVRVSLYGDNFGVGKDIKIFFGNETDIMWAIPLHVRHTEINFTVPPGEGRNLSVTVRVSNQTGESVDFSVGYQPPRLFNITPVVADSGFPPSGCQSFEKFIRPGQVGVMCQQKILVRLLGDNFGRYPSVNMKRSVGEISVSCTILNSSHTEIIIELPPGLGRASLRVQAGGFDSNDVMIEYSRPRLDGIVYGKTILTATVSNTFDAKGSASGDEVPRIFFLGENFGEEKTEIRILVGGQECLEPIHHGWSGFETLKHPWQQSGRPYLSCIPQETTVGRKGIIIAVAGVIADFNSPSSMSQSSSLYARCFEHYYGLMGEYCVECWHFETVGRSRRSATREIMKIYATTCKGEFSHSLGTSEPIANDGFSILPPQECLQTNCLFDGKRYESSRDMIPDTCVPVVVEKVTMSRQETLVLATETIHMLQNEDSIIVILSLSSPDLFLHGVPHLIPLRPTSFENQQVMQRLPFRVQILDDRSFELIGPKTRVARLNSSLFSDSLYAYVSRSICYDAVSIASSTPHPPTVCDY